MAKSKKAEAEDCHTSRPCPTCGNGSVICRGADGRLFCSSQRHSVDQDDAQILSSWQMSKRQRELVQA